MSKTLVISRVFPPQVGGNGRWMWELYSRLPHDNFVIVADRFPGSEAFDRSHDLSVIRMPLQFESWGVLGWRRGTAYYGIYSRLCRIVRERHIESVHASNCLPDGFLAWMLRRRFGLPYLVYVHGEELIIAGKSRELHWMARQVYRDAKLVIANSRNTARLLIDGWPVSTQRVRVMHPGVDTREYRPAPRDMNVRRRLGWGDCHVVLTVGRLMKRKGHESLIRSLPEISKSVPDVLYAIIGDGDERQRLEQLVNDLKLHGRVVFHGELDDDDVRSAHQQCDLFALPNREINGETEGFGIVLLEAQACGIPVIAGDSGGTAEAVNAPHSGRIVRQDHPDELAKTISELLRDDAQRERMGQAGREWAVENFDWQVLMQEADCIFSEAAECSAKTRALGAASSAVS